jgi:hypothetical protein
LQPAAWLHCRWSVINCGATGMSTMREANGRVKLRAFARQHEAAVVRWLSAGCGGGRAGMQPLCNPAAVFAWYLRCLSTRTGWSSSLLGSMCAAPSAATIVCLSVPGNASLWLFLALLRRPLTPRLAGSAISTHMLFAQCCLPPGSRLPLRMCCDDCPALGTSRARTSWACWVLSCLFRSLLCRHSRKVLSYVVCGMGWW